MPWASFGSLISETGAALNSEDNCQLMTEPSSSALAATESEKKPKFESNSIENTCSSSMSYMVLHVSETGR